MKRRHLIAFLACAAWAGAAGAAGLRPSITYADLTNGGAAPADMQAFTPPADAKPASNVFEGRLTLGPKRAGGGFTVLKDQFGDADSKNGAARHMPPFDFEFVQSGDALIPVQRGAIPSSSPEWEYILEPGRVWDQPGDHGMTRAALPVTLEERNANCMHNGVLTFLFGKNGAISNVAYEIASETCFYFKFNMWGMAAARYAPSAVANAAAIASNYAREVAARLPTRPIETLSRDFPGADPSQFGSPSEVPQDDMTLYGFVAHGVNYVSGCGTRFGAYPFCAVLDLPSYSLAKSIVAGLASMRLEQLYPGITQESIAPYVPACAATGTWNDVTIADTLDMATGHYLQPGDQADEDAPDLTPFFLDDTHAQRIAFACTHYPRKDKPGTRWIYHTADMYILGTALQAFYRSKVGGDFYNEILARDIWAKLKLNPAIYTTRRTYDSVRQPFTGYGLTLNRDDIAKIADFINVDHGAIGGTQLLNPAMLRDALQQNPASPGLRASTDDFRYHDAFWAWNAQSALGCKAPTWIPFMSGYGGIIVALMPNGMTYYYFSDSGIWRWAMAAAQADRIKPFCAR